MNNHNETRFGDNINNGQHIGNIYQQNIYASTDVMERKREAEGYSPATLFEKKPRMNVLVRLMISAISLVADVVAIAEAIKTQTLLNVGVIVFVVLLGLFAIFLLLSALDLIFYGRCGKLRRVGINVFVAKTHECPICAKKNHVGKLRLIYENGNNRYGVGGNYLVCSNDPKDHRWYVTFPKEKK